MFGTLIALALAAQPAAPADNLAGIWEGNVGTLPVRACFSPSGPGQFGAYYYLSQLRLIALTSEEGRPGYGEGEGASAARWQIERAGATQLTARWTSGQRTLPVQLRRVAGATEDEGPCSSLAFHQPRLAGVRTVSTRVNAVVAGLVYTRLTLDHGGRFNVNVETFALDGDSEAVRRLNATLGESLNGNPPEWLDCIRGGLDHSPFEGEYNASLEPAMISQRWLSVTAHNDYFCGGAHPDASNGFRLYDLTSGREVNPHDWFTARAVKREHVEGSEDDLRSLEPAFRTFLLADWRVDPNAAECGEVVRGADFWNIGLTRDGFVFSPDLPHVVQACFEEFTVDFARIRPWLTPEGAAAVAALQAERPRGS